VIDGATQLNFAALGIAGKTTTFRLDGGHAIRDVSRAGRRTPPAAQAFLHLNRSSTRSEIIRKIDRIP
jgi:hypothetical protein